MRIRVIRFLVLSIVPILMVAGFILTYAMQRSANPQLNTTYRVWSGDFALHSVVVLLSVAVIRISFYLAEQLAKPFDQFIRQVNAISTRQQFTSPEPIGIADIDSTLETLHNAAMGARSRLDAERTLAADVSHQLRSPLTALLLRLEQIESSTTQPEVREDASAAIQQVDRLVIQVEHLLTTWRATSNRDLQVVDVSTLVREEADRWQSAFQAENREIVIDGASGLSALATPGVQTLVLSVLLDNSLKHGKGTTQVRVSDYQSWVLIEVGDEGQGIADELSSEWMNKGVTTSGTGLGLPWARSQAAADGGRLELRSLRPAVFGLFLIAAPQGVIEENSG